MLGLQYSSVTVPESLTPGTGQNKRVRIKLRKGEAAFIKKISWLSTSQFIAQAVCKDPNAEGAISLQRVWTRQDLIAYNPATDTTQEKIFPEPGFPVVDDVLYMVDYSAPGQMNAGCIVWYEVKEISQIDEALLLVKSI